MMIVGKSLEPWISHVLLDQSICTHPSLQNIQLLLLCDSRPCGDYLEVVEPWKFLPIPLFVGQQPQVAIQNLARVLTHPMIQLTIDKHIHISIKISLILTHFTLSKYLAKSIFNIFHHAYDDIRIQHTMHI